MFKNKILSTVLKVGAISFLGLCAISCGNSNKDGKIKIVTTIFPQYDWAKNIVGDNDDVSISFLVNNGIDLHSYQPSVRDIATISTCDIFIYSGGESDEWVEDALKNAKNKNLIAINLLEELGEYAKEEEVIEGMEGEEDEEDEDEEDEDEVEYDEHTWLSIKNASFFVDKITSALSEIDGENANYYQENAAKYKEKLDALDQKYDEAVNKGSKDTLLFGDRFPFRYLTDDYNLKYYAAFVGCSAETEASFSTIAFLANKVDELELKVILTIEGNNHGIAETIKNSTKNKNQEILVMNSLQSIKLEDANQDTSYISVMESNLVSLKKAVE